MDLFEGQLPLGEISWLQTAKNFSTIDILASIDAGKVTAPNCLTFLLKP